MANLSDHLFRQARERAGKIALIFENETFTFSEIAERVRGIAGGLASVGVTSGTRVGLMLNARPEFILFQQALFALGAVVAPLNIFYRKNEIAHVVASCDLQWLIIDKEFENRLPKFESEVTASIVGVLVLGSQDRSDGLVRSADDLEFVDDPIAGPVPLDANALGLLLSTSATTGKSKGVMLSIANIRANYDATPRWLGLSDQTVTLCALPLYNTFGLNQGINATMVTGATLVLMPRFDASACLSAIQIYGCNFLPAVPTMLQKLVDHPSLHEHDLTSIDRILTGGAPVPASLLERVYAIMGTDTDVMTGYGLTEGTALVSLDHIRLEADRSVSRPKSIGRVLPGMDMRISGPEGKPVQLGEVGEICIRGPNVMQGYYKMPQETALAIVDGWLHTGDLGLMDRDGTTYIVDRKKDVIIRGGQNIYPADIEEVIYRYPGVREVAVIGRPDTTLGEVAVAFVSMTVETDAIEREILKVCRDELAYYKVPVAVHVLTELPKGPTGKILRRALRAD